MISSHSVKTPIVPDMFYSFAACWGFVSFVGFSSLLTGSVRSKTQIVVFSAQYNNFQTAAELNEKVWANAVGAGRTS